MNKQEILNILREEIVPAQGCTEPIAIAYVAAKAKEVLGELPLRIDIYVSGNMIKNVKSVTIPNSEGMIGIEAAVALGLSAGDSKKELMVISDLSKKDIQNAKHYLETNPINVIHDKSSVKLYIKVEAFYKNDSALVEIKHFHTNITRIEKNKKILVEQICNDINFKTDKNDRAALSIKSIYDFAKSIDTKEVEALFDQVIRLNSSIAKAGLKEEFGVNIGSLILKNMNEGFYGKDIRNKCVSFTAAGSDARMSGCSLPVMTTSGSGNQGMTASLPIIKYAQEKKLSKEQLIRGLVFSHLCTIHLKTSVGRLSAYCGVMCAASAVAGGIAFLEEASYDTVANSISNNLGNVSGIICDGAKASCATKIATGLYAAFDSSMLALNQKYLQEGEGIISSNVEATIKNIGVLAQSGMKKTDEVILNIMQKKT